MKYKLLTASGALREDETGAPRGHSFDADRFVSEWRVRGDGIPSFISDLTTRTIDPDLLDLLPESVARENLVIPLAFDGERLTLAAADPRNIALADKLRFLLAKDIRLVGAPKPDLLAMLNRCYGWPGECETVDSMLCELTDTAINADEDSRPVSSMNATRSTAIAAHERRKEQIRRFMNRRESEQRGRDHTPATKGHGMFFYTVEEGQRVLMIRRDGTMQVLAGPIRVWQSGRQFRTMEHYVAHPGEFLIVQFRDGHQEHLTGPAEIWFDPRIHQHVETEDCLQIAAKEAVVVYSRPEGADGSETTGRRIVHGPAQFVPAPGEWLHTFSWHASQGGSHGVRKVPNALVFNKLWLMPDQMYHDVPDVRTADDAVLTIRLMIFFELVDIERMLDTTHDPIGDFVNAATADVVEFTGRYDFEAFKRNTDQLNDLATYEHLAARAARIGYRINNVVYRGYGAPESLQQMHNQAIEARTRLQLERATEQQAQELENFKLESQMARASRRRSEQTDEVRHDLELTRQRETADLENRETREAFLRNQRQAVAQLEEQIRQRRDQTQLAHLTALRGLGVDLTAYLTQSRADRVIELRGAGAPHVHLDRLEGEGQGNGRVTAVES